MNLIDDKAFCLPHRDPGNQWALEMAKFNLVNKYLVVGVTEEMADFVAILEATLPRFFAGATELYNSGMAVAVLYSQILFWGLNFGLH